MCARPLPHTKAIRKEDRKMTREELIRKAFVEDEFDMLVCRQCKDALYSRGEKYVSTESAIVDMDDLEIFFEDGGLDEAEDGSEPCGCEWCGEIDNLYGIWFR